MNVQLVRKGNHKCFLSGVISVVARTVSFWCHTKKRSKKYRSDTTVKSPKVYT